MTRRNKAIELHGAVWMTVGKENFGGHVRMALLEKIADYGSITQAAHAVGMSYKAAWKAIDMMNNLAGEPLVKRLTGGKGGGGTRLTERGKRLVTNFKTIENEHRRFIKNIGKQTGGVADDFLLIGRIELKTSARNQFFGKVINITPGAVNDEIELEVAGKIKIVAIVSCESTKELGLCIGAKAFALIPSSQVILMTEDDGKVKLSTRNQLAVKVTRVQPGAVNTEVVMALPGGGTVAAMVTNESSKLLKLKKGRRVKAIFKASSVILGVAP